MDHLASYRQYFRKEVLPSYYSGRLHILLLWLTIPSLFLISVSFIDKFLWSGVLAAFLTLVYCSLHLYLVHRFLLHQKVRFFGWAHKIHMHHHLIYDEKNLNYEHVDDLYMLLNPPGVFFMYYLLYLPLLLVPLYFILPAGVFPYVTSAFVIWFGFYEFVHFGEHAGGDSKFFNGPFFRWVQHHHSFHHDHKLMHKVSFDIVFPFFDFIFKTAPKDKVDAEKH